MSKSIKHIAVLLCISALLSACTQRPESDATALRIAFEAAPANLDPRYATDAYASRIASLVFATLTLPSADGGYEPYVAARWETPDDRTWVFHLRSDFRFHDGSRLSAKDVAATYRALIDPRTGSPRRTVLGQVEAVEAPTPATVVFRLTQPNAAFLEAATLAILPEMLAAKGPLVPRELIGAGPYRIDRADDDGGIRLLAFPGFPMGQPSLPAIHVRVIADGMMRALELRHGSVDLVQNALDPDTVDWIAAHSPELAIYRGPSSNVQYLGLNLEVPLFADVRVRRALAHAIDRDGIVRHILKGQARVADGVLPPEHWAYASRKRRYGYDAARARRLLDRAGIHDPDGAGPLPRVTLSYKTTTQELARRTGEVLAQQLGAVGIRLEISSYEWATFFDDVRRGNFQMYSLQWVGITDPDAYRQVLHSAMVPPRGNNRSRYRNPRVDSLTERAAATLVRDQRRRLYARIQRLEARELPYVPLWWPERVVVSTRRLSGFTPAPSGDLFALYRTSLAPPPVAAGQPP